TISGALRRAQSSPALGIAPSVEPRRAGSFDPVASPFPAPRRRKHTRDRSRRQGRPDRHFLTRASRRQTRARPITQATSSASNSSRRRSSPTVTDEQPLIRVNIKTASRIEPAILGSKKYGRNASIVAQNAPIREPTNPRAVSTPFRR